jgi:hypothetical protein
MSVVAIICTVKKFLKVAVADGVPFVRDGTVAAAQLAPRVLTWANRTDETPLTGVSHPAFGASLQMLHGMGVRVLFDPAGVTKRVEDSACLLSLRDHPAWVMTS